MQGVKDSKDRSERLYLRATPEEKEAISKAAAAAGLTITSFLIGCALGDKLGQALIDGKQ